MRLHRKAAVEDFVGEALVVGRPVGIAATERCVKHDAEGPDVCSQPVELPSLHDLRRHIQRRPTICLSLVQESRRRAQAETEAEIDELGCVLDSYQHILELEVAMGDSALMEVVDRGRTRGRG